MADKTETFDPQAGTGEFIADPQIDTPEGELLLLGVTRYA